MKKLLLMCCFFSMCVWAGPEVIDRTGFYGVYVESMPFWTFWNYKRALRMIAEETQQSVEGVSMDIELNMPVLTTWDYGKAKQLADKLKQVNCDLVINQMQFVANDEHEASAIRNQLKLKTLD